MRTVFLGRSTVSSFQHFIKLARSVAIGHHVAPIIDSVRDEHIGCISELCDSVRAILITPHG
jgi:hypothetical protein